LQANALRSSLFHDRVAFAPGFGLCALDCIGLFQQAAIRADCLPDSRVIVVALEAESFSGFGDPDLVNGSRDFYGVLAFAGFLAVPFEGLLTPEQFEAEPATGKRQRSKSLTSSSILLMWLIL
jgi:hypothetical protein